MADESQAHPAQLDRGRIVAQGGHDELVRTSKLYAQLAQQLEAAGRPAARAAAV